MSKRFDERLFPFDFTRVGQDFEDLCVLHSYFMLNKFSFIDIDTQPPRLSENRSINIKVII